MLNFWGRAVSTKLMYWKSLSKARMIKVTIAKTQEATQLKQVDFKHKQP